MRRAELSLLILGVAAVGLSQASDKKARELLLHSMQLGRSVPVSGLIMQRMIAGSNVLAQLRIEQGDGKVKLTVLSPLSLQGVTTLDDGETWSTFQPDDNRLIVQPSPRINMADPQKRITLTEQNYRLRLAASSTIAGRKTVSVVAKPRSEGLPERHYFFDERESVLLRLETREGGGRRVLFDTAEIAFPNAVRADVFKLNTVRPVRTVKMEAPMKVGSAESARKLVGFKPVLPAKMPFGFIVQESQIAGSDGNRFYAIRLTDGLISATVYQWRSFKKSPLPPGPGQTTSVNSITFRIVGELPELAGEAILESFAGATAEGQLAHSETLDRDLLLYGGQGVRRRWSARDLI